MSFRRMLEMATRPVVEVARETPSTRIRHATITDARTRGWCHLPIGVLPKDLQKLVEGTHSQQSDSGYYQVKARCTHDTTFGDTLVYYPQFTFYARDGDGKRHAVKLARSTEARAQLARAMAKDGKQIREIRYEFGKLSPPGGKDTVVEIMAINGTGNVSSWNSKTAGVYSDAATASVASVLAKKAVLEAGGALSVSDTDSVRRGVTIEGVLDRVGKVEDEIIRRWRESSSKRRK